MAKLTQEWRGDREAAPTSKIRTRLTPDEAPMMIIWIARTS